MDIEIEPKKKHLGTIVVLVLAAILWGYFFTSDKVLVDRSNMLIGEKIKTPQIMTVSGSIKPISKVIIASPTLGRIEKKHVENGALVAAGTTLLTISAPDLTASYRKEKLELELLGSELESENAKQAREIFSINNEAQLIEIDLSEAVETLEAYRELAETNNVSKLQLRGAEFQVKKQRKLLSARTSQLIHAKETGALLISSLQKRINLQRKLVKELEIKTKDLSQKAPFTGVVTQFTIDVGGAVSEGQSLLVLNDKSSYIVELLVPDYRATEVKQSAEVELILPNGKTIEGEVLDISRGADSGFVTVTAKAKEDLSSLPIDQNLKARISLNESLSAVRIKRPPFYDGGLTLKLYVVDTEKGKAELTQFRVHEANDQFVSILSTSESVDTTFLELSEAEFDSKKNLDIRIVN